MLIALCPATSLRSLRSCWCCIHVALAAAALEQAIHRSGSSLLDRPEQLRLAYYDHTACIRVLRELPRRQQHDLSAASPTGLPHLEGLVAWSDICKCAVNQVVGQGDNTSDRHLELVSREAERGNRSVLGADDDNLRTTAAGLLVAYAHPSKLSRAT